MALIARASLALLVLLQLVASSPLDLHENRADTYDDSVFLLGVGKADITGYINTVLHKKLLATY
jgi:hypothetical protein